ncbi:MAG: FAD-dependent oxidoreductase [Clostridia bacterium]|nr:FAD-dependent oxidoreductase [Clostridia bacterium]
MERIRESLETPVTHSCRTAVAGGGVAGISAALAAARHGADVLLIEREFTLGGLATLGLITIYLPICDGRGRQVIYGIGEELIRLSALHGCEYFPEAWLGNGTAKDREETRFEVGFNPDLFALECERLLLSNGVRILYGTQICSAARKDGRVTHIICENKSGRFAVECTNVVDATGDADVAVMAGANTSLFAGGNIAAGWYYSCSNGKRELNMIGFSEDPGSAIPEEERKKDRFSGVDGDELSRMMIMSHSLTYGAWKDRLRGEPDAVPCSIAGIPQLRMTRRINGLSTPSSAEEGKDHPDSVGLFGDWRKCGPVYALPFGSLCSDNTLNLLAAGRDISVTDDMWDITRVIPCCAVTGEAAGTAAALFDDFRPDACGMRELQARLRAGNVRLSMSEI